MNKFTLALTLGTGLTLSLAAPSVQADAIQNLSPLEVSASTFNKLFAPIGNAPAMSTTPGDPTQISLANKGGMGQTVGSINSEVFKGSDPSTSGLYAYAYQLSVSPSAIDSKANTPMHLDGTSFIFNGNPIATTALGTAAGSSFLIKDGTIGGLTPLQNGITPDSLSFQVNGTGTDSTGSLRANFVNAKSQVPPLNPGDNSATFVVISDQPFSQSIVNVTSSTPQVGALTSVYAPNGTVFPSPVPEPTTILAWAGMAGAVALVRRIRKSRPAIA
jgi:type 1 fimbria pilin